MASNRYIDRFNGLLDRDVIFQKALYKPEPLKDLELETTQGAVKAVREALKDCFYPTKQCLDLLEQFVQICHAHSKRYYQDPLRTAGSIISQTDVPLPSEGDMLCFTGLAGVGKSHIRRALSRVLSDVKNENRLDNNVGVLDLNIHRIVKIDEAITTPKSLWGRVLGNKSTSSLELVRLGVHISGTSLLVIDEIQFGSHSRNSNALITSILLSARKIGIPVIFISNFSLLHTLSKRNNQDLHRLLADKVTLKPDAPTDADWIETLRLYRSILPNIFKFDPDKDAERIFDLTFGLRRATTKLLEVAYRESHSRNSMIGIAELEAAVEYKGYEIHRSDTAKLKKLAMNFGKAPADLYDPFETESPYKALTETLTQKRQTSVNRRSIEDTYPPAERKALRKTPSDTKSGKVVPIKKKDRTELMQDDLSWFANDFLPDL